MSLYLEDLHPGFTVTSEPGNTDRGQTRCASAASSIRNRFISP